MRGAFSLAAMLVVLGIFMPRVLADMEVFLHAFFGQATVMLHQLPSGGLMP